jgi:hypothetical protein
MKQSQQVRAKKKSAKLLGRYDRRVRSDRKQTIPQLRFASSVSRERQETALFSVLAPQNRSPCVAGGRRSSGGRRASDRCERGLSDRGGRHLATMGERDRGGWLMGRPTPGECGRASRQARGERAGRRARSWASKAAGCWAGPGRRAARLALGTRGDSRASEGRDRGWRPSDALP